MDTLAALSLDERKLIVGIDFGTTYSGIAWAETRRTDHQSIVDTWPARVGRDEGTASDKVPTQLRYTPKGVEWGFQIPSSADKFQWFKLGLEGGKESVADGQSRTSDELTTDYLTALVKHLMYILKEKLGGPMLAETPIEFCLTVPAMWSEAAKEKTLKACQKAGLKSKTDIMLVSEPEAAAIYAISGLDPHGLAIGETIVLCDAGGGTVDLVSYTIMELLPTLKVKEAAAGSGEMCGSTFLNRRFGEFLKGKLGNLPGWDDELLEDALERFDSIVKKEFLPSDQEGFPFPVYGLANDEKIGIKRGKLTVTPAEMKTVFDPVIGAVIKLVKAQISTTKKKVKAVLLVGGFGQNNYLKNRLRASLPNSIMVLQPPNAWTAVVRGAVMMGLARNNLKLAAVESRVARKHYGVELAVDVNSSVHDVSKKYWSDKYNDFQIQSMVWLIKKGDPIREDQPTKIHFTQEFPVIHGRPESAGIDIECDARSDDAPVHKTRNVRKLVTLRGDLSHITQADLANTIEIMPDGNNYYCIRGFIEATFYSASTKYVLVVQGKRYDAVTAEYA